MKIVALAVPEGGLDVSIDDDEENTETTGTTEKDEEKDYHSQKQSHKKMDWITKSAKIKDIPSFFRLSQKTKTKTMKVTLPLETIRKVELQALCNKPPLTKSELLRHNIIIQTEVNERRGQLFGNINPDVLRDSEETQLYQNDLDDMFGRIEYISDQLRKLAYALQEDVISRAEYSEKVKEYINNAPLKIQSSLKKRAKIFKTKKLDNPDLGPKE